MCGITALSRVAERSSIGDPQHFMRLAAIAIESRGKDATGFAWVDGQGAPWYWKAPKRAYGAVRDVKLDSDLKSAIGHTRFATQGKKEDNRNNHPVLDEGIMLVHNGVIDNDWEMYELMEPGFVPLAEVDSQVIATMLAHPEMFGAKHPTELLELLEGNAAVAWLSTAHPDELHLARCGGRPLTIGWTRRGDLVMSSTKDTLADLAFLAGIKITKVWEVPEGVYLRVIAGEIVEKIMFEPTKPKKRTWTAGYGLAQQPPSPWYIEYQRKQGEWGLARAEQKAAKPAVDVIAPFDGTEFDENGCLIERAGISWDEEDENPYNDLYDEDGYYINPDREHMYDDHELFYSDGTPYGFVEAYEDEQPAEVDEFVPVGELPPGRTIKERIFGLRG